MTIWHMRITSWIPKAANTHSEYVMLIALPLQQWLLEHASMLRYPCIVSLRFYFRHVLLVACVSCTPAPSYVINMHTYLRARTINFANSSR